MKIELNSAEETELFGAKLWHALPEKCLVYLHGELGAGKTTLVRGVLREAGYDGVVKSPTYTLVEEYRLGNRQLYHFDLYRLKEPEELEWIGIRDFLQQNSLLFIEWPEMGSGFLPEPDIVLTLRLIGHRREIECEIFSEQLTKNINLRWKNKDIVL